jgi:hypothetical protein
MSPVKFSAAMAAGLLVAATASQAAAAVLSLVLTGVGSGTATPQGASGTPLSFQDVSLEFDTATPSPGLIDSAVVHAEGETATLDLSKWISFAVPSTGQWGFGSLAPVFIVAFDSPDLIGVTRATGQLAPTPVTIDFFKDFDATFGGQTYDVALTTFTDAKFSFTTAGSATPEPAAWALMILGFGGAGAMLRRRRPIQTLV